MKLSDLPITEDPQHLLLIADSKVGKTTYVAQAVIDGFHVIYVDSDNGLSSLRNSLAGKDEATARLDYLPVTRPVDFVKGLLRSTSAKPFVWNATRNSQYSKLGTSRQPDDALWIIDATLIPKSSILSIDSWTSLAADALGIGDVSGKAALLDGTDQSIYGDANANLTYISNLLQKVPYHVIVQAHGTKYEVYDKPVGVLGKDMKQGQMTLREVIDVPVSSSRPHGVILGSRFNQIGWMGINNFGNVDIDFTRKAKRIGGGTPNIKASLKDLPFSKLATVPNPLPSSEGWLIETTVAEYEKS